MRVPLIRDHLSTISGITPDGQLLMQVRSTSCDAAGVGCFLSKVSDKFLLIWDGSPIHRVHEIKDFLKRGAAKRLHHLGKFKATEDNGREILCACDE